MNKLYNELSRELRIVVLPSLEDLESEERTLEVAKIAEVFPLRIILGHIQTEGQANTGLLPKAIQKENSHLAELSEEQSLVQSYARMTTDGMPLWRMSMLALSSKEERDELLEAEYKTLLQSAGKPKDNEAEEIERFKQWQHRIILAKDHAALWQIFLATHHDQLLFEATTGSKEKARLKLHPSTLIIDKINEISDVRVKTLQEAYPDIEPEIFENGERPFRILSVPCISAMVWMAALNTKDPNPHHFEIVREALSREGAPQDDDAVDALARELTHQIPAVRKVLKTEEKLMEILSESFMTHNSWIEPSQENMLWIDYRAAQFLDSINLEDGAEELREAARKRWIECGERIAATKADKDTAPTSGGYLWSLWLDPSLEKEGLPPVRFVLYLARLLWKNIVRAKVEKQRNKPKALVFPVLKEAIDAHTPGGQLQRHQGSNILVNHRGELVAPLKRIEPLKVPTLELSVLPQILRKGSKLLGTLNAYRLLHLEVSLGHQRALDDIKDFRALRFEGGWGAVAEAAGIEGNSRAISEVHAIIAAQAHLCWVSPDGTYGNLLSYEVRPARRNQRGRVSLILGDSLLPDFIFSEGFFGNGRKARESRRLVPMLPLPPLVGRDKDKGAQVNLQLRILAEMRQRAGELYQEGGILLPPHQLEEFAKDAALPLATLNKVIERWTKDGDDGPALLELIEDHRYTLGKTHQTAKDFITQAGEEEIKGREAGLKSRELDRKRPKKQTPHE
jgi:hypothetical protein